MIADEKPLEPKEICITSCTYGRDRGYAYESYKGVCGTGVVVRDIRDRIYNPHSATGCTTGCGGHGAWVRGGKWKATRHVD